MKRGMFLKAVLFVVLVNYTTSAQEGVFKSAGDSIPVLEEWWRAPEDIKGLGRQVAYLPDFYNGHDAMAVRVSLTEVHTWLNRFPGDTQNVFTWQWNTIGTGTNLDEILYGDFNADGIRDYATSDGFIYQGVENGKPPMPIPAKYYLGPWGNVYDVNKDGFEDLIFANSGSHLYHVAKVLFGGSDLANLQEYTIERKAPFDSSSSVEQIYQTPEGEIRFVVHQFRKNLIDGFELYRASWEKGGKEPVFTKLASVEGDISHKNYAYHLITNGLYQIRKLNKTYFIAPEHITGLSVYYPCF